MDDRERPGAGSSGGWRPADDERRGHRHAGDADDRPTADGEAAVPGERRRRTASGIAEQRGPRHQRAQHRDSRRQRDRSIHGLTQRDGQPAPTASQRQLLATRGSSPAAQVDGPAVEDLVAVDSQAASCIAIVGSTWAGTHADPVADGRRPSVARRT